MSFYVLQVSFEQIYYALEQKPNKIFQTRLKEINVLLARKRLELLDFRVIMCVHRSKILNASIVRDYEFSREWEQYLYSNVVDPLFVSTSQPLKDRKQQMLRLDTSQPASIRVPTVH